MTMRRQRSGLAFTGALTAALCAGCAHYTPMTAPKMAAPEAWRGQSTAAHVDTQWWTRFGDPALVALVNEALEKNADVRIAATRMREARASVEVQRSQALPSLDLVAGGGRSRTISPATGHAFDATAHQSQFQAAYEVDLWGRIDASIASSEASLVSAAAQSDAVALSMAAAVADLYISLVRVDAQLEIARRTLRTREQTADLMRNQTARGQVSELESAQSEAEKFNTAQSIPLLIQTRERLIASLNVLLDRAPGDIQRGTLAGIPALAGRAPAGIPSELVRRRPDIFAAEADLVASDAQLAAARAQLLPSIRLTASFGRAGSSVLHDGPFTVWGLGGSILAPIFSGDRLQAQVRAADARRDRALLSYRRTVITAFSEVETQLSALENANAQLAAAKSEQDALTNALRVAKRRYQAGYASFLDELFSERNLFLAQQNVATLNGNVLQAEVALYKALGGGWVAGYEFASPVASAGARDAR